MKWTFLSFHPKDKSCGYTLRVPKTYVYMEKALVVIYFSVVFFVVVVAMNDLVYDVEAIHGLW